MKKNLLTLLALAMPLVFTGCDNSSKNNNNDETKPISFETMYDYSAISGINMLNMNAVQSQRAFKQIDDSQKEAILGNLQIVENMLSEGIVKSEELTSDKEGYEKMYTIEVNNFTETKDVYTFYYNEKEVIDHDDDDDDLFEVENETNIAMSGLVIMNDVEYKMIGEKEIEGDEKEVTFKISLDESNYVIIEQETESGEVEYEYTHYDNGKKVYETSLEIEQKRNGKVEFEFEEKAKDVQREYTYEFVTRNDQKYVEVKIKENKEVYNVTLLVVVDENNQVTYKFVD